MPSPWAMPIMATPMVAAEPHEVPVQTETRVQMRKALSSM